ncbi:MAG: amidophosphoribosyltransferase [Thermoguttaceae bacterium]
MNEIHEECGIAAVYHLDGEASPLCPNQGPSEVSRLLPRMLLDLQNRGQLAAGITTFRQNRQQIIDTYKEVGTVSEVFHLAHRTKYAQIMDEYAGNAAIGHVRYATCGRDDRSYAQPFERHHIKKHKWFSFAFNGQLSNYAALCNELLADGNTHLARETDTEVIMHYLSAALSAMGEDADLLAVMQSLAQFFDGSYSLAYLNAIGEMFIARDPLGMKPLCYAIEGNLFAAASESVALFNLGFSGESIRPVAPGEMIIVSPNGIRFERFAESTRQAHCFFEWVYFANVASTIDSRSVYLARKRLGEELARIECEVNNIVIDDDTIVVPVPDTSKGAADGMAYALGVPCLEGLIRNRYSGRTFIEGGEFRLRKAETKYTPLREVLEGKRVVLVDDSIVRSTSMRVLLRRIRELGRAKEIHVRVACPPIISPCFYGIDMSTYTELYAPQHFDCGAVTSWRITPEIEAKMAADLGADSLRYLPVDSLERAIGIPQTKLCQACVTGSYPTPWGTQLAQLAFDDLVSLRAEAASGNLG